MLLVMKMPTAGTGATLNVVIAVVLAVVIILLGMGALLLVRMLASREVKKGIQQKPVVEGHQIYRGTGKCIDCESQFKDEQWRGGSNKCYDCEKDLVARTGSGYGAMKSKCFDC